MTRLLLIRKVLAIVALAAILVSIATSYYLLFVLLPDAGSTQEAAAIARIWDLPTYFIVVVPQIAFLHFTDLSPRKKGLWALAIIFLPIFGWIALWWLHMLPVLRRRPDSYVI